MATPLERALAETLMVRDEFTADDVTLGGDITLDATHQPNGAQNGIGSLFNRAAKRQLIEFTGRITRSTAPHRKGGGIRVWRATEAGRLWARSTIGS